ncbi:MAG: IS110 family transposase [Anaerolineales bacterium]|nr:MAG: IS110 family transposase [Anaerolineales bacterium]
MEVIYARCAGLDVHKKTVVACVMHTRRNGRKKQETRTFGTTTCELQELLTWLQEWGCTHVALESTGVYWQPVYNILEDHLELLLVNARHVKNVPGRKTDVTDAEWLADLLRHGLLRGSFVPPREQRNLRDLTRQRSKLVEERAAVVNRLQKVLEDANIKVASVATDVMGVSGRAMLAELMQGPADPTAMAQLARGRMRTKREALTKALTGHVTEHHRFLLKQHLIHADFLDAQIAQFSRQIETQIDTMSQMPEYMVAVPNGDAAEPGEQQEPLTYARAIELLDTIPGIDRWLAQVLVAEMGIDMSRFATEKHLASWAGVAPGNNESAGKRRSGKTPPGNRYLRKGLVQGARGASRKKNTYLKSKYHRIAARRGKKKATVAVGHSILVSAYHMLSRNEPYRDLGGDYFDQFKRDHVANHLVRRLEKLGFQVQIDDQLIPDGAGS